MNLAKCTVSLNIIRKFHANFFYEITEIRAEYTLYIWCYIHMNEAWTDLTFLPI